MAGFFTTFNVLEFQVNGAFSVNSTEAKLGNVTINSSSLNINTSTVGASFRLDSIFVGNSTINSTINSTSLKTQNSTFAGNYGSKELTITGASLTSLINSTSFAVSNTTTGFFTCNSTNLRLGVTGNLANLTPTRLELGDGTTFFSPDGLSIAGGATMNTTHLDVDEATANIAANFVGNSARLDMFGSGRRGIVNASTGDANTVLSSGGSWVKSGFLIHSTGRGDINQSTLDITWNGEDYAKIEVCGWLRPHVHDDILLAQFSHDGSTFTGFSSDYHQTIQVEEFDGPTGIIRNNESDMIVGTWDISNVTGIFFIIEIHNHHGAYSTVQLKSAWKEMLGNQNMDLIRSSTLISNTNTIQGIRFDFDSGNIRSHSYDVKIYPN